MVMMIIIIFCLIFLIMFVKARKRNAILYSPDQFFISVIELIRSSRPLNYIHMYIH